MKRRKFIQVTALGGAGLVLGCKSTTRSDADLPVLSVTDDAQQLKNELDTKSDLINDLASTDEPFIVEFPEEDGTTSQLKFEYVSNNAADYRHLRITNKGNGGVANILWAKKNFLPAISFTDDDGNVIVKDETELTVGFNEVIDDTDNWTKNDLLSLGWKLLAVGLAVWLGAKIAGLIVSAIAFIAFTAFALGAVLIAVEASVAILTWLQEQTGWTMEDIQDYFNKVLQELSDFIDEILIFIQSY